MDDKKLNIDNAIKNNNEISGYSIASFILSAAPIAILLIIFLFCLLISVVVPGGGSVIWWLLIGTIAILGPASIITNILSIIFGVIGLRNSKRTVFAWGGIIFVFLDVLVALVIFGVLLL